MDIVGGCAFSNALLLCFDFSFNDLEMIDKDLADLDYF